RPAPPTSDFLWSLFQPPKSQTTREELPDTRKETTTTTKKRPIKKQAKKPAPQERRNATPSPAPPVDPALRGRAINASVQAPPLPWWHMNPLGAQRSDDSEDEGQRQRG